MDIDTPEDSQASQPPVADSAFLLSCANERPLHEHAQRHAAQHAQQQGGGMLGSEAGAAAPANIGTSNGSCASTSGEAAPATAAAADAQNGQRQQQQQQQQQQPQQTAGGRAAHMLPVVLALVEAVVEALARDAAAADEAEEALGGVGDGSKERGSSVGGSLDMEAAQQVMAALERVMGEVVAFLEVVAELKQQQEDQEERSVGRTVQTGGLQQQQQQQEWQEGDEASMQDAFVGSKPPSAVQLVEGVRVPEAMQARLPAHDLVLACVRVVSAVGTCVHLRPDCLLA